jgi:Divergent InlB B-repeat domain
MMQCLRLAEVTKTRHKMARSIWHWLVASLWLALCTIALCAITFTAQATVVPSQPSISSFFVVGATCTGPTATTFIPGGAPIQVTWCVTTTNPVTDKLCGHSVRLRAANSSENGRFRITNRVLGPNFPDPNSIPFSYTSPPIFITNPAQTRDYGGTFDVIFPILPEANQLLATFTLAPQTNATNSSYVISLDSFTGLGVDTDGNGGLNGPCADAVDLFVPQDSITFNLQTYNVTPTAGANGTISPNTMQAIGHGRTTTFTVTPSAGYNAVVTGTCGGTLVGNTYTTNVITGDCTVIANFNLPATVPDAPTIGTATAGNTTASVTFTAPGNNGGSAITGYTATCGGQSNSGMVPPVVVTGLANGTPVTCSVVATNAIGNSVASAASNSVTPTAPTFNVTPSAGANGTITPSTPQTVTSGATSAFTVTPNSGYSASVGGTCGGSLVATTYTTNAVTANCTVIASFSLNTILTAVQSRKTHGAAGVFDLAIDTAPNINGAVTVEPRMIGSGHKIVFQFNQAVTTIGTVTAIDPASAPIGTANAVINPMNNTEVIVTLTNVADIRRVTIALNNINATLNVSTSIGFMVGDVNNTRVVSMGDITDIKLRAGQPVSATTFMYDVNTTGTINASDVIIIRSKSGGAL